MMKTEKMQEVVNFLKSIVPFSSSMFHLGVREFRKPI